MNCLICNNEIKTRGAKKYCSYECRNKSYIKIKKFDCLWCKKNIQGTSRQLNGNRKFCSTKCSNFYKSIKMTGKVTVPHLKLTCLECGKEFMRMPSKIHSNNVFCSLSCKSKFAWKNLQLANVMVFKPCWTQTSKGVIKFRSKWEVAFAVDFLDTNKLDWEYEQKSFILSDGHKYTPDFFIKDNECFIEIKGYDRSNSTEKFYKFKKENPNIPIVFANKQVLENIYKLNLDNKYLDTIVYKTKEG